MPADNIKRAIQKGTGELEGATYEEITLEGYGPGGVAILVEAPPTTATAPSPRSATSSPSTAATWAPRAASSYMFKPRATSPSPRTRSTEEKLMELALEAGADDIQADGEMWEVYTRPNAYEAVLEAIKKAGIEPDEAEIGKYAENNITLEGAKAQQMLKLIEALEDNDDVQNVWANFDISDKELEAAAARLAPRRAGGPAAAGPTAA